MPPTDQKRFRTPSTLWLSRSSVVFVVAFAVMLGLKGSSLDDPAAGDATFGVFPAAATLADTGFDYPGLLSAPGYLDGGPNTHPLSLVTLVTAVAIAVLDRSAVFPVLHVVHIAAAALAAAGVHRLAARGLGSGAGLAVTAAAMAMPVVITQAGMMYLEMPLLAATAWALVAWLEGRRGAALALAVVAAMVKQSGLVVGGALALAALVDPSPARSRRYAAAVFAIPLALIAVPVLVRGGAVTASAPSLDLLGKALVQSRRFAERLPDLVLILVLFLLGRPLSAGRPFRGEEVVAGDTTRVELLIGALVVSFLSLHVVTALLGIVVLPRYWVQILPMLVIGLAMAVRRIASTRAVIVTAVVVATLFLANINGALYPPAGQASFPLVERSGEYRALLRLEERSAAAIAALPDDVPVVYTLADHFRVAYPASGYVTRPIVNGIIALTIPDEERSLLATYPDDFFLVADRPRTDGGALAGVWEQAERSRSTTTQVIDELTEGEFSISIVRVTRRP